MRFRSPESALRLLLGGVTEVNYVPNKGNAGDALQTLALKQLLEKIGISVNKNAPTTLVSGGGNLVPLYHCLRVAMSRLNRDSKIIVMPSTVVGCLPFLKSFNNLMLLAREEVTHRTATMHKIPTLAVADTATAFDFSEWETHPEKDAKGLLRAFRTDKESTEYPLPDDNRDISNERPCLWWTMENCEETARWFVTEINKYKAVETNRCHVAIVAGLLGKKVTLHRNSYHKNKSIYAASLSHLPNVIFDEA